MKIKEIYKTLGLTNAEYDLADRTEDELIAYLEAKCGDENVYMQVCTPDGDSHGYTYLSGEVHMVVIMTANYFVLAHELAHVLDKRKRTAVSNIHDNVFMTSWINLMKTTN